jgi:hypothetical protein
MKHSARINMQRCLVKLQSCKRRVFNSRHPTSDARHIYRNLVLVYRRRRRDRHLNTAAVNEPRSVLLSSNLTSKRHSYQRRILKRVDKRATDMPIRQPNLTGWIIVNDRHNVYAI